MKSCYLEELHGQNRSCLHAFVFLLLQPINFLEPIVLQISGFDSRAGNSRIVQYMHADTECKTLTLNSSGTAWCKMPHWVVTLFCTGCFTRDGFQGHNVHFKKCWVHQCCERDSQQWVPKTVSAEARMIAFSHHVVAQSGRCSASRKLQKRWTTDWMATTIGNLP